MAEQAAKLTKRVVDAAEPASARYVIWDSELKGFGLRVETSGTKSYLVRYRAKGLGAAAPKRFITLGRHGPLSPEQARLQALGVLGAVATGRDPAADKASVRAALNLSQAAKLFLTEHVGSKRKSGTRQSYEWLINSSLIPELGAVRADQVTRAQVMKLHSKMQQIPYQANRMLAVLGSLYTFLGKSGHVPEGTNPARGIERYREQGRERYLTSEELSRLGAALREGETVGFPWSIQLGKVTSKHLAKPENQRTLVDPGAITAIRLLILTGARLREILHLRWEEVDLERGLAFLPDSKTGRKTLVLSSAVARRSG